MNNPLQARLKANLNVVLIFFIIASIFSILRITSLINTNAFHIDLMFSDNAYVPILIQGFGFLAILASSISYRIADRLSESHQVILLCTLGVAFIPYTIILYVVGIMKFIDDNRYKLHFFLSSIVGMLLFGLAISIIFL